MATFTYTPDNPVTESSAPVVSTTAFGTYEQRTIPSINTYRDTWALKFSARTATERNNIYDFLVARKGTEPFTWTTPFSETAQFVCPTFKTTLDSCFLNTVEATFELQYVSTDTNIPLLGLPSTAFTWTIDFACSKDYDTRPRIVPLGDGYSQRFNWGMTPQTEAWSVQLNNRTNAERTDIRNFLRGCRGRDSFLWTSPLPATQARYICSEWSITQTNHNDNSIQATFKRVFEP